MKKNLLVKSRQVAKDVKQFLKDFDKFKKESRAIGRKIIVK